MTRDELFASIVAAGPGRDDLVYLERRGDSYNWRMVTVAETPLCGRGARRVDVDFPPPGLLTNRNGCARSSTTCSPSSSRWPTPPTGVGGRSTSLGQITPTSTERLGRWSTIGSPRQERTRFKRCRRQWDFASPHRRNLRSSGVVEPALPAALKDALGRVLLPGHLGLAARGDPAAGAQGARAVAGRCRRDRDARPGCSPARLL